MSIDDKRLIRDFVALAFFACFVLMFAYVSLNGATLTRAALEAVTEMPLAFREMALECQKSGWAVGYSESDKSLS